MSPESVLPADSSCLHIAALSGNIGICSYIMTKYSQDQEIQHKLLNPNSEWHWNAQIFAKSCPEI